MTALAALAAAAIAPPEGIAVPPTLEPAIREACAGAWRAVEVVLAGDVLRGRLGKTRDAIVRDAVESVLALHGNVSIRADALASLRAARDAGALDGPLDLDAAVAQTRAQGAVAAGRAAIGAIRRGLADYRDLEQALSDPELGSLLVDAARAIFRTLARDPELMGWAIGPTGSPGRDRALSAFSELASSPDSIAELDALIALPIHLDDNVQFTVYRPRSIDPGKWHQLLAFAHLAERRPGEDDLPDPVEEVQRQAAAVLGAKAKQYSPIVQDSGAAIPAEGELTFVPEFPGIEVNPPRRSFLWLESVHREEFRIRAGRELDGKTVRGRVTVFLGHIAIAEVACTVKVDAARPEALVREPTSVRAYRKIFASYSHRDLDIVNQFETYARALGDEYLRDWVHLRTGEVWTDRLCQLIDQADAFQLFWSRNSMHSKFVRQEYEYALSLNRPSFVRPTYWEDPMPTAPGLPPEALLRLHFQKLGAEMIGAAGRSESNNAVARKRSKAAKRDDMAVEREREPTTLVDEASARPQDLDVTDPQYSLPDMKAAESSVSMAASAPPAPPLLDFDEEAPSSREPEPFDTARMERRQDELDELVFERAKREIDPRKLITDPGIGSDNRAPARPSAPVLKKAMLAEPPTTAPGISSSARPPAPASPPSPAPSAPAPSAPSRPAPGPSAPARISQPSAAPARMPSPAPSRPAPAPSAPAPVSQPAQPAPMRPAAASASIAPAAMPERPAEPPAEDSSPSISPGFAQPRSEASPIPTTSPGVLPMQPVAPRPSAAAGLRSPASPIPTTSPGIGPAPRPIEAPPGAMPGIGSGAPPSMPPPAAMASAPAGPPPASPWQRPNLVGPGEVSPYAPTMPQETYKPKPGEALFSVDPEANAMKAEPIRPNAPRRSMLPLLLVALGILLLAGVIAYWLLR